MKKKKNAREYFLISNSCPSAYGPVSLLYIHPASYFFCEHPEYVKRKCDRLPKHLFNLVSYAPIFCRTHFVLGHVHHLGSNLLGHAVFHCSGILLEAGIDLVGHRAEVDTVAVVLDNPVHHVLHVLHNHLGHSHTLDGAAVAVGHGDRAFLEQTWGQGKLQTDCEDQPFVDLVEVAVDKPRSCHSVVEELDQQRS